jgi:hypothetical protein
MIVSMISNLLAIFLFLKFCLAVQIAFKTSRENEILIIGEIQNSASSVQINKILKALNELNSQYNHIHNEIYIPIVPISLLTKLKKYGHLNVLLYEVECADFMRFISSMIFIKTNIARDSYLSIYEIPKYFSILEHKLPLPVIDVSINLKLEESMMFDLNSEFSESFQISTHEDRSASPILEYGSIYGSGGNNLSAGLLRNKEIRRGPCDQFSNCCTIM